MYMCRSLIFNAYPTDTCIVQPILKCKQTFNSAVLSANKKFLACKSSLVVVDLFTPTPNLSKTITVKQ